MFAQITIQEGQTLSGIAGQFSTDISTLISLNPQITDPDLIIAGQQLTVPETITEPILIDTEDFRVDAQANQERLAEITRQIEESQTQLVETREQLRVQLAEEAKPVGVLDEAERVELGITISPEEQAEQTRIEEAKLELDTQQEEINRGLDQLSIQADENATALINQIRARFDQRRREMEDINRRSRAALQQLGIRAGAARRAGSFVGIISAEERAGLDRLTDLDRQESELILAAKVAARTEKFDILAEKMDAVESKREQINKEIEKFNKSIIERNKMITLAATIDEITDNISEGEIFNRSQALSILLGVGATVAEANTLLDILGEDADSLKKGQVVELSDGTHILINPFTGDIIKNFGDKKPKGFGGLSGNVQRDADTIMQPLSGFDLNDIPTKDGYRAAVAQELAIRKQEALDRGDIVGIIRASAGGRAVDATTVQSLEKAVNVLSQIAELQSLVDGEATGPIWGAIRSANPYDARAQVIKGQLSAIVPNLARGIYGEVGVLTDNDVKIYSRTLPNLQSIEEVREALLGLTLLSVQRSIENKIRINAALGRDVSGIEDIYLEVKTLADRLLSTIQPIVDEEITISGEVQDLRDKYNY